MNSGCSKEDHFVGMQELQHSYITSKLERLVVNLHPQAGI